MKLDLSEPKFYEHRSGKYFQHKLCSSCSTTENLTRHHIKSYKGKKTGQTQILCRKCHDKAERVYEKLGIVERSVPVKLTENEQLQLDYINGLLPFYSLKQ